MTIRVRLVVLYTAALVAILLPFLAGTFLFVRAHVLSALDEELTGEADEALLVMSQWAVDGSARTTALVALERLEAVEDVWFEVWSSSGELVYRNRMPEEVGRSLPPVSGREEPYDVRIDNDTRFRVLERALVVDGREGRFRAVAPAGNVDVLLSNLLVIHLVGLLVALGLAGLSGNWLARRALAPVQLISERARVLTTDRLKEGIPVVNPRDELGELALTFNATFARLADSLDQLRRFAGEASHELRNPLAAIRNVAEIGLDRNEPGKQAALTSILEEVERMTRILDGLLTLARAENGQTVLAPEVLDLGELSREVVEQLTVVAEGRAQQLRLDVQSGVRIFADPLYVRQALMNIIDNAIKYGVENSPIDVRVETRGSTGVVTVTDRGPGIAPEHRERVFERFYSVDKQKSRAMGGSGLGLALASWGVRANGGSVDLITEVNRGSTFRITLPARPVGS